MGQAAAVVHTEEERREAKRRLLLKPDAFSQAYLGWRGWGRQVEVMRAVAGVDGARVSVRSGHGVGKSALAANLAIWFTAVFDPAIVLTTAPTQRQVQKVLWAEVHHWLGRSEMYRDWGELISTEWRIGPKRYAVGVTTNEADRFQGYHCENMLVIVDEAGGVPAEMFVAIDGLLTGGRNNKLLLIGNPTVPEGYFFESQKPGGGFQTMRISALESPNVVTGTDVIPGLVTREWVEERKREWGEESPVYRSRVLGEFPDSASNALITLRVLQAAEEVAGTLTDGEGRSARGYLGCDVSRYGGDETVIVVRRGKGIIAAEAFKWTRADIATVEIAGRIMELAKKKGVADADIFVDDIGVGGGVTDVLRAQGHDVVAVIAGASAEDPDLYANQRAEMWCRLADAMAKGELSAKGMAASGDTGMPERMKADLVAQTYGFTPRGQRKLDDKEIIKRRLGRSPDWGDALALTYSRMRVIGNLVY